MQFTVGVVLFSIVQVAHAGCADPDAKEVLCVNCDFEQSVPRGTEFRNLGDSDAEGWECRQIGETDPNWENYHKCGTLIQSNKAWGFSNSDDGSAIAVLHGLVALSKTINNLDKDKLYTLYYLAAERPNRMSSVVPTLTIRVNNVVVVSSLAVPGSFSQHSFTFTPARDGTAKLEFENDTPDPALVSADHASVFLDKITIQINRGCGEGGSCHNVLPGQAGTHICRCDLEGYIGAHAVGKPATCHTTADLAASVKLSEEMVEVKKDLVALYKGDEVLEAQIIGVAGAISTAAVATTAAITELNNTQSDAVGAVSDAVAELRAEVAELKGLNAKLIAAVVAAGAATGPGPRDDDDAGGSNTFVPEITAADGRLNFAVKQGGRVTVNGEVLLPASEIELVVQKAVADALQQLGASLGN